MESKYRDDQDTYMVYNLSDSDIDSWKDILLAPVDVIDKVVQICFIVLLAGIMAAVI